MPRIEHNATLRRFQIVFDLSSIYHIIQAHTPTPYTIHTPHEPQRLRYYTPHKHHYSTYCTRRYVTPRTHVSTASVEATDLHCVWSGGDGRGLLKACCFSSIIFFASRCGNVLIKQKQTSDIKQNHKILVSTVLFLIHPC